MAQDGHSIVQTSNAFNPGLSAQDSGDAQCDLAAAMLFRPELLDGYGDLVWAELFTEPIHRDVASLFKLGVRSSEQVQQTIRASGDYIPGLLADEFLGLEDLAITLRHDHLERAVTALRTDDHITYHLSQLPLTDYGNAQRLVVRHGHDLRYAKALGWLQWDGRRWRRDDTGEVERRVKHTVRRIYEEAAAADDDEKRMSLSDWAQTSESAHRMQKMREVAWSEPGITVTPDQLDADPWLFNVLNGTIDLRTGELREHRRGDLITKLAPVEYDAEATCPTFDRFIVETTCGREDVAAYLQQFLGICLTGDISEQVLPVW
ncbi:MAG: hypothetical protein IH830_13495 [Planctomycetes bacterium]|nr:hypothetical protein [Planctomycetota bacterium]